MSVARHLANRQTPSYFGGFPSLFFAISKYGLVIRCPLVNSHRKKTNHCHLIRRDISPNEGSGEPRRMPLEAVLSAPKNVDGWSKMDGEHP